MGIDSPIDTQHWEFLARHHGVPTTILDWTASPYVAAYFAFAEDPPEQDDRAAVWVFDKEAFAKNRHADIDLLDTADLFMTNERAILQRSQFLRFDVPPEELRGALDPFLFKYEMPRSARGSALNDLDQMTITARSLFRDLDSAGKTATWRVFATREVE